MPSVRRPGDILRATPSANAGGTQVRSMFVRLAIALALGLLVLLIADLVARLEW